MPHRIPYGTDDDQTGPAPHDHEGGWCYDCDTDIEDCEQEN